MLKRKEKDNTVRTATAKSIDHLAGQYIISLGEKHILEIKLILRVFSRAVESDLMESYQAVIIRSVTLPFK